MPKIIVKKQSLKYPPRIEFGSLQRISTPESYGNMIKMFCTISKGERPLLPDYGLPKLIHTPPVSNSQIEAIFRSALTKYFREVTFTLIKSEDIKDSANRINLGSKKVTINYAVFGQTGIVEIEI
nr:hypothetical protein [uncultured Flavobacterium sp.]